MCVRWLATVRSPRKSAAATSRFVRPSATSAATRCSAGVRPSGAGAAADPPELGAGLLGPAGRAERLEAGERRLDRLPGRPLLPRTPPDDAEREQRPRPAERIADRLVLARPPPRAPSSASSTSPRAAASRPRQRATCASTQCAADAHAPRLPGVQQRQRPRRSGRARAAPRRSRRATSGGSARPSRPRRPSASALGEPRDSRSGASPLHRLDDALDRGQPAEVRALLVGELAAARARARGRARARRDGRRRAPSGNIWSGVCDPVLRADRIGVLGVLLGLGSTDPPRSSTSARYQSAAAATRSSRSLATPR